ncbi:MAG TPA: SRPBCC domain-containing protein [Flavobacteriales bacterium]|nr:SRPBCC domain-containing protein [Flavobacteriales bacterium]
MQDLLTPKQLFELYKNELFAYAQLLPVQKGYAEFLKWANERHSEGYPKRDIHSTLLRLFIFVRDHEITQSDETAYDLVSDVVHEFTNWGNNSILPNEPPVGPLYGNRLIHAPVSNVWNAITNPIVMKQWIYDTEVEISSSFEKGSSFILKGDLHGMSFENKGRIWEFEPQQRFIYDYVSSLSGPDQDELDATFVHFELESRGEYTLLKLTVENARTEVDFKHLELYWGVTLDVIKNLVENLT